MNTSKSTIDIYTALLNATKEIQTLKKDAKSFNSKYITLEFIINYLKPILVKHGLVYIQMIGKTIDGCISLTTRLVHAEAGEFIENEASIPLTDMTGINISQQAGAAVSYLRRYSLTALFGIAENDTDGISKEDIEKKEPLPEEQTILLNNIKEYCIETNYTTGVKRVDNVKTCKDADKVIDGCMAKLGKEVFKAEIVERKAK